MDLFLQILSQNEGKKDEQSASSSTDKAATPLPAPNNQLIEYQSLATPRVRVMLTSKMEKLPFKRRKVANTKLRDFTNPSSEQCKVSDLCEIDSQRPYDKERFKNFMKWLDGKVDNKNLIDLRIGDGNVQWFLHLKALGKWLDGGVRNFLFVSSFRF